MALKTTNKNRKKDCNIPEPNVNHNVMDTLNPITTKTKLIALGILLALVLIIIV